MPNSTDCIMIIITSVYVIATIVIGVFNYKTVKATREQTAEVRRQFNEINRAFITFEFIYVKKAFFGIRFTNHGRLVAKNVKVHFKEEFIDNIKEEQFRNILGNQKNKTFILGIGQSYDIFIGSNRLKENDEKQAMEGLITYEDEKSSHEEKFYIDLENYATFFSVKSETEELLDEIKNQTSKLASINRSLESIGRNNVDEIYK